MQALISSKRLHWYQTIFSSVTKCRDGSLACRGMLR